MIEDTARVLLKLAVLKKSFAQQKPHLVTVDALFAVVDILIHDWRKRHIDT